VKTEAAEIISKLFAKYLNNIPGKHKIKDLPKKLTGHSTHTAASTNVLNMRNSITCAMNSNYRTDAIG